MRMKEVGAKFHEEGSGQGFQAIVRSGISFQMKKEAQLKGAIKGMGGGKYIIWLYF